MSVGGSRTSWHRFVANQFRLLLCATAYLLICLLRAHLAGTELANAQVGTLRVKLFKVGVRVRQTTRKLWLHFASAYPLQRLWEILLHRLRNGPPLTPQTLGTHPNYRLETHPPKHNPKPEPRPATRPGHTRTNPRQQTKRPDLLRHDPTAS